LAIPLLSSSCNFRSLEVGSVQTEYAIVELDGSESIRAEISLGAGLLKMAASDTELMEATIINNVSEWTPIVEYDVIDEVGYLGVRQPGYVDSLPIGLDEIRCEWDLRLNRYVPLDLSITMGAGEGNLALSQLHLDSLIFRGGAGGVFIDLSGSTVSSLDIALGAGNITVDLSGERPGDLTAAIKGGLGRVNLILPESTGVLVRTQGVLKRINAPGFHWDNGLYTNDAFGQSHVSMAVDVEAGIGEITLEIR
jgi:hypothetical protein